LHALKPRAIFEFTFLPCGVTEAGVGFGVAPRLKTILATDFAERLRLSEDSHVKSSPTAKPPPRGRRCRRQ
jgi:hypothetical protein